MLDVDLCKIVHVGILDFDFVKNVMLDFRPTMLDFRPTILHLPNRAESGGRPLEMTQCTLACKRRNPTHMHARSACARTHACARSLACNALQRMREHASRACVTHARTHALCMRARTHAPLTCAHAHTHVRVCARIQQNPTHPRTRARAHSLVPRMSTRTHACASSLAHSRHRQ